MSRMAQTKKWYDNWEITTYPLNDNWTRKVIKLPNSHTIKQYAVYYQIGSAVHQLTLDLESALYTLTQHDKEHTDATKTQETN